MRTFVVAEATDLDALGRSLLVSRLGKARSAAVLEQLRAANPHLGEDGRLDAGTLVFVPDVPGVAAGVGITPDAAPAGALRELVTDALKRAAADLEAATEARIEPREALRSRLASAEIRRLAAADDRLARRIEEAARSLEAEAGEDKAAAERLGAASKAILATLDRIGIIKPARRRRQGS